jgi:hypothetical protein
MKDQCVDTQQSKEDRKCSNGFLRYLLWKRVRRSIDERKGVSTSVSFFIIVFNVCKALTRSRVLLTNES